MMTLKDYPSMIFANSQLKDVLEFLRIISNIRKSDITLIKNLPNTYIGGRKVERVPTGSANVLSTDYLGDFNVTDSFAYYLVDSAGTPVWRRVAVSSW